MATDYLENLITQFYRELVNKCGDQLSLEFHEPAGFNQFMPVTGPEYASLEVNQYLVMRFLYNFHTSTLTFRIEAIVTGHLGYRTCIYQAAASVTDCDWPRLFRYVVANLDVCGNCKALRPPNTLSFTEEMLFDRLVALTQDYNCIVVLNNNSTTDLTNIAVLVVGPSHYLSAWIDGSTLGFITSNSHHQSYELADPEFDPECLFRSQLQTLFTKRNT